MAVATGLGSVWVADSAADVVIAVDSETGQVRRSFPVGSRPTALSVGPDAVWVASMAGDNVSRISP